MRLELLLVLVTVARITLHRDFQCPNGADVECHMWHPREWGPCSAQCEGKTGDVAGVRTRVVYCPVEDDDRECVNQKPPTVKPCVTPCGPGGPPPMGPLAKPVVQPCAAGNACKVTLYGAERLEGWSATFGVGVFNYAAMCKQGARCQDVSSIVVEGPCCTATLYKFPDCNEKEPDGWKAKFPVGKWWTKNMVEWGAVDNDSSCIRVESGMAAIKAAVEFEASLNITEPNLLQRAVSRF